MTLLRLIRSEFTRLTSSIVPVITIIGLALIPLLYAGVYLYANWDPYDSLDDVDAALVNLDHEADFDGEERAVGDDVTADLVEDASFTWHEVDSREEAEAAVAAGDYQFALVIPESFSTALASPSDFESAEQATLEVTVNEANNYLLTNIVDALTAEVHDSVAQEVSEETADAMLTSFGRIHQQLVDAAEGADELHHGAGDLQQGVAELYNGSGDLVDGAAELNEGTSQLISGTGDLSTGSQELSTGADELQSGASQLHSGLNELLLSGEELNHAAGELQQGAGDLNTGLGELSDGAEQVATGTEHLAAASDNAAEVIGEFETTSQERTSQAVDELIDAGLLTEEEADEASAVLDSATDDAELLQRASGAREDLNAAHENIDELATGARDVADGAAELSTGADSLHMGTSQLASSTPELVEGLQQAQSGASNLGSGASELSAGADELHAGTDSLAEGAVQLDEGTSSLSEGAVELHQGLNEASTGSADLTEGAAELEEGLHDGAGEVPDPDDATREELSQVMGDPVDVNQHHQAEAGNYGTGMAPFFVALSLWIGALVLLQVLRPLSARALASNARSTVIAAGSWIPCAGLALIQAVLAYAAVVFGVGLTPAHPVLTLALLVGASAAFTALIHGAVAFLGNPGKMAMLVLLVLQLVGSGGMFPPEALPAPLQALHPALPMTYVVDGLRHMLYGGDLHAVPTAVVALVITAVLGYLIQVAAVRKHKMWSLRRLQPPIQEVA